MGDKVLVVDDELQIRNMLTELLTREGYEVIVALNGEEAMEIAKKEDPRIILLDINMPVMDGLEACKRLKAERETSSIPVIMMTGHDYSKEEAIEAGADEFINKPFDLTELSFRLKSVLRVRYLTDEIDRLVADIEELQKNRPMS